MTKLFINKDIITLNKLILSWIPKEMSEVNHTNVSIIDSRIYVPTKYQIEELISKNST